MDSFTNKAEEKALEFCKDVADDIIRPTSKSIGNNIGLFVDGVMGWLGYWGEKQKIKRKGYLLDYKDKILTEISIIPENKLQEPSTRILGPIIEASKYYIEENTFREMFSKLIASSCNSDISTFVHPAFPEIIKQLAPIDARFLKMFQQSPTFPCVELYEKHIDEKITPFTSMLFDFKNCKHDFIITDELKLTGSLTNLIRLGLVKKNNDVIELNYDYESFKQHKLYSVFLFSLKEGSIITMKKNRIELTEFGKNFTKCCF